MSKIKKNLISRRFCLHDLEKVLQRLYLKALIKTTVTHPHSVFTHLCKPSGNLQETANIIFP